MFSCKCFNLSYVLLMCGGTASVGEGLFANGVLVWVEGAVATAHVAKQAKLRGNQRLKELLFCK